VEIAGHWHKSSYSTAQSNCVQIAGHWHKSSYSNEQGNCVEAAHGEPGIVVRDSKDPGGPVLRFGVAEWATFTSDVKAGSYGSII
jgi:uncharacterized protein DUF397